MRQFAAVISYISLLKVEHWAHQLLLHRCTSFYLLTRYSGYSVGAWILTPGSNTGVYKMVGSAVKDYIDSTGSSAMNNIVLLGIASWGSVTNRDYLSDPSVSYLPQYRFI